MGEPNKIIRVLIADDHPMTRNGIRAALEKAPDIEIVGEAQDGAEAQQTAINGVSSGNWYKSPSLVSQGTQE